MSSDRIADLCEFIAQNLGAVFDEARDQLSDAITACVEDAQEEQKDAILSLSVGVKWNLDGNSVVLSMPVNVRRRFEKAGKLDDGQQTLPGVEE